MTARFVMTDYQTSYKRRLTTRDLDSKPILGWETLQMRGKLAKATKLCSSSSIHW
jgi:hypothetical protein